MSPEKQQFAATVAMQLEQYHDRWTSVSDNSGIIEVKEKPTAQVLKQYEIFKEFDDSFLDKISPDISIARWKSGAILFEEGSYIDIAFYLAKGTVRTNLRQQKSEEAGNPIFDTSRTMAIPKSKEVAQGGTVLISQTNRQLKQTEKNSENINFLATINIDLSAGQETTVSEGDLFGEIGALIGWPQPISALTATECEIVQVRVPALIQMKRLTPALKAKIDELYKERILLSQLKGTPLFRSCDDAFLQSLKNSMELISCEAGETITTEGEPTKALYMVRSGFVKLSQKFGSGNIVATYLSKGMTLGEVELLLGNTNGWVFTAVSVEHTELVKISKDKFQELVSSYPEVENLLWESAVARIKESGYSRKDLQQSEFIDTALKQGLVEGNSIFVIDLDECTRCDDCVRACADTHDGIPRFVREGNKFNNILITRACYHCEDPVCLVGCPTGAIHRAGVGTVVEIVDELCIGCKTCANNCPYDAITMRDTGENWSENMIPKGLRNKPKMLATKCDLCYDKGHGPACVSNCPHGCAFRVGSVQEFQSLVSKKET